ncbi:hypothetical protein GCM10009565_17610 [Amycolatopsis albidoflavus]
MGPGLIATYGTWTRNPATTNTRNSTPLTSIVHPRRVIRRSLRAGARDGSARRDWFAVSSSGFVTSDSVR